MHEILVRRDVLNLLDTYKCMYKITSLHNVLITLPLYNITKLSIYTHTHSRMNASLQERLVKRGDLVVSTLDYGSCGREFKSHR